MKQSREWQSMKMEGTGRQVSKVRSKQKTSGGVRSGRLFNNGTHACVWVVMCTRKMSGSDKGAQPRLGRKLRDLPLFKLVSDVKIHCELILKGTFPHFGNKIV